MPVINPIWFYLMSVCHSLRGWLCGVGAVGMVVGGIIYIICKCEAPDDYKTLKQVRNLMVVGVIALGISVFIPTKATMEQMLIAQNVTYERVEQATDTVTDVYNDIMDLFRESEPDE